MRSPSKLPLALAAFVAGLLSGAALTAGAVTGIPFDRLEAFAHALSLIESRYVDERDADELLYDAIGGLTQGLDDHSVFLDPKRYAELLEQTSGEYFGVGIEVRVEGERVIIVRTLPRSPAEEAGVQAGDELRAIDGQPVSELGPDTALTRVRGPRGTIVVLTLAREGLDDPLDVSVERDQVRTVSVRSRLLGDVVWLKVERFQRKTGAEVQQALAEARRTLGRPPTGLIVDMRGNPGGYLSQAVAVADLWLSDGRIVSTVDRGPDATIDRAHRAGADTETPIVVLVDGGSASAAEIVAGALQDQGRALLVGETTYGKGSVQQFFELSDGSALKLTTARYYTPSGRSIHGSGIEPDLPVDSEDGPDLAPLLAGREAPPGAETDLALRVGYAALLDPEAARVLASPPQP